MQGLPSVLTSRLLEQLAATPVEQLPGVYAELQKAGIQLPALVLCSPWSRDERSQQVRDGRIFRAKETAGLPGVGNQSAVQLLNPAASGVNVILWGVGVEADDAADEYIFACGDQEVDVNDWDNVTDLAENILGAISHDVVRAHVQLWRTKAAGGGYAGSGKELRRLETLAARSWNRWEPGHIIAEIPPGQSAYLGRVDQDLAMSGEFWFAEVPALGGAAAVRSNLSGADKTTEAVYP